VFGSKGVLKRLKLISKALVEFTDSASILLDEHSEFVLLREDVLVSRIRNVEEHGDFTNNG
jgi:hypothetical protein